jgi:hypothetical protein
MKLLPLLLRGALALLATPTLVLAQGALTPPGAPNPTMRSLDQLGAQLDELQTARIAVNDSNTPGGANAVYVINDKGHYYLTSDITIRGAKDGVLIADSDVTLDLNGHRIVAADSSGGYGVKIAVPTGPAEGIVVRNGTIAHCGGGVFSDASRQVKVEHLQVHTVTGYGVFLSGPSTSTMTASDIQVTGATVYGIMLSGTAIADSCTVTALTKAQIGIETRIARDCTVQDIKGDSGNIVGIMANTAENCAAIDVDCTSAAGSMILGIWGEVVRGCRVENVGLSSPVPVFGIGGSTVETCSVAGIHGLNPYGIRSESGTVRGCKVVSVTALSGSTEGYGIRADVVQGCTVGSLTSASTIQGIRGVKVSDCEVGDITGVSPSGIVSLAGVTRCYVRAISATAGTTYGYGINATAGAVTECTVNALHCASGQMYGILGTTVRDCRLSSHGLDAADTGTHYGIATSLPGFTTSLAGVVEDNSLQGIRNIGISLGQGSIARGNAIYDVGQVTGVLDGKAIVGPGGCRIEGNTIGGNSPDYGIFVTGTGSLIVGNHCTGIFTGPLTGSGGVDTGAYNITANNRYGPIVIGNGAITATVEGTNFAN